MKKLLLINRTQFGYHIDSYKYCQYLKNNFEITYICFDTGKEKIHEETVTVIYVPYQKSFIKKGINFIKLCRDIIEKEKYDIIFIVHFLMASLIKLGFEKNDFILDIRTGSVNQNKLKRIIEDNILRIETCFFKKVTIISESLSNKLNININKVHILPLGSDSFVTKKKTFKTINLLYVGTLSGRDIFKTILGLAKLIENKSFKNLKIPISYDIIGFGTKSEENLIKKTIEENKLEDIVIFHGRKLHNDLESYFESSNIGISFIPITDFYQCQPPTKTFEYINSGLYCIATNTKEHQNLINDKNGILCEDNSDSFFNALLYLSNNILTINQNEISLTLRNYTWEKIIIENLLPYLENKGHINC